MQYSIIFDGISLRVKIENGSVDDAAMAAAAASVLLLSSSSSCSTELESMSPAL